MLVDQGYNYRYISYGHPYKFKFNPDQIIPTSKCHNSKTYIKILIIKPVKPLLYSDLFGEYIYLDHEERRQFANGILSFNHPVKELIWTAQELGL